MHICSAKANLLTEPVTVEVQEHRNGLHIALRVLQSLKAICVRILQTQLGMPSACIAGRAAAVTIRVGACSRLGSAICPQLAASWSAPLHRCQPIRGTAWTLFSLSRYTRTREVR